MTLGYICEMTLSFSLDGTLKSRDTTYFLHSLFLVLANELVAYIVNKRGVWYWVS
jgi:hypothetical protein